MGWQGLSSNRSSHDGSQFFVNYAQTLLAVRRALEEAPEDNLIIGRQVDEKPGWGRTEATGGRSRQCAATSPGTLALLSPDTEIHFLIDATWRTEQVLKKVQRLTDSFRSRICDFPCTGHCTPMVILGMHWAAEKRDFVTWKINTGKCRYWGISQITSARKRMEKERSDKTAWSQDRLDLRDCIHFYFFALFKIRLSSGFFLSRKSTRKLLWFYPFFSQRFVLFHLRKTAGYWKSEMKESRKCNKQRGSKHARK